MNENNETALAVDAKRELAASRIPEWCVARVAGSGGTATARSTLAPAVTLTRNCGLNG